MFSLMRKFHSIHFQFSYDLIKVMVLPLGCIWKVQKTNSHRFYFLLFNKKEFPTFYFEISGGHEKN